MARVSILPVARGDLIEIGEYIALDSQRRVTMFLEEIVAVISEQIALRPLRFPARDDLALGLRAARHPRYMIFFTCLEDSIEVVRVPR